jgi:hypothetical protein
MEVTGVGIGEFGPGTVEAFIAAQSAVGRILDWKAGSWAALLEYLRSIGVPLADAPAPVVTPADALLAGYAEYEARERALLPCRSCGVWARSATLCGAGCVTASGVWRR